MNMRYPVLATLLAAQLAGATAAPAQNQTTTTTLDAVSGATEIDKISQTQDVKFRNEHDDRMTVPVRLSGSGPYRFLVDTGADRTAVSRELVAALNLPSGSGAKLHSVAGVTIVTTARIRELELTHPPDLSIDAAVLERINMGADGIVGVDLLRSQRVVFDFSTQTMSIVPSASPDFAREPGTIVVRARRKNGRLIVTDAEADGTRLTIILDTGSQICIGNEALRRRLMGPNLVDVAKSVELESVTGAKIRGNYMFLKTLDIGGIGLSNLAIVFADAHTFKQLGLDNKPALLLGMNAIRAFKKVSIDFANKKFRVVLPEHSALDTQVASAAR